MRGDETVARGLLILSEGESMDFKSMHESIGGFELGEAKDDGGAAVVVAAITAKPGQDAPPPLPLVMTRVADGWKIDMGASINRMMGGVDLEALMAQMAQGLGDAMAKGMEGLGEAMAQGLGTVAQEHPSKQRNKRSPRKSVPQPASDGEPRLTRGPSPGFPL